MDRIPLSNKAFEGKNNVYLLDVGDRTILVDTGLGTDEARTELRSELSTCGVEFSDITDVFLTHWHHDHSGLAGDIQEESGADVYVHEADVGLVRQDKRAWEEYSSTLHERFDRWEMPADAREELLEVLDLEGRMFGSGPEDITTITDGETVDAGSTTLEVLHLPGHTEGLCGFAFEGEDGDAELFSGDALLPKYTPNVGGADVRVESALRKYLRSLHRIAERDFSRAWPGHRTPIPDPTDRAAHIISHHNDRAQRVLDIVREHEPIDTWSVSDHLFGSLSSIHIIHGPGEAYAHLEHLGDYDLVAETEEGFVCPDPDRDIAPALAAVPSSAER